MSRRCPESGEMVLYLDCQECETRTCEHHKENIDRITKNTSIGDAQEILKAHGYQMGHGWAFIMSMVLHDCDYVIVKGYGKDCYFEKHIEEDDNGKV
jgi:hypothetical protein